MNLEQRGYQLLTRKTKFSYGDTLAEHQMRAYRIAVLRAEKVNMYVRGWGQAYLQAKREFLKPHKLESSING